MKERNYICGGNKFTYSKGYITLPVEINDLPESILIEGETLYKKPSFHASLLCVKDIIEKHGNGNMEERILNFFCSFVKENDISFVKYSGEFRFAKSEERKSLVALCEISNLKKFSESLGQELGIEIPPQPTHVTLYTLQPDVGIGLNNPAAMEEKSAPVQVPEVIRHGLGLA
ncbi:MAG: hypothetical protein NUV98_03500 [Candidatus Roizmanbacteria bacterium]|nr:hypothetical protein [Candidatus Roizmanbacteria bacterium]